MKKIKKISPRLSNGNFSSPYPLGADSINIDMISGNNLEEELHLGSPSNTTFREDENGTIIITEEYRKENQINNYYTTITTIVENIITQRLYLFKDEELHLKKTKVITFTESTIKEVIE